MSVTLGKQAPDFTADAFDQGRTRKARLDDYRSRWVVLFFYPADFSTV
jgi:peroxiredoxin (alkyl hydroperoxide reductase subunit C)